MANGIIELKTTAVDTTKIFEADIVSKWLRFAGVADKTVATYKGALKQLFKYFNDNQISRPFREDLENWRDKLIAEKKSASTVQLYLAATKVFFRFLADEKLYSNIADHLKSRVKIRHEHKRDALSATQSADLLKAVHGDTLLAKRNRAILGLMLSAALRTIEIERANIKDLRYVNGICFLSVQGKGHSSKDADIRVAPQVEKLIRDYLSARGNVDEDSPLFVSTSNRNRGARISTQAVRKMIKAYLRSCGLDSERLSAHSLRHSAALQMLLNGASLEQVQQVLRHVSLNTTMIYNHAITRMKNEAELIAANAIFGVA